MIGTWESLGRGDVGEDWKQGLWEGRGKDKCESEGTKCWGCSPTCMMYKSLCRKQLGLLFPYAGHIALAQVVGCSFIE